jgi:hypothetical protein
LTQYGSADLVNRFWKEFPKKRVGVIRRVETRLKILILVKNSRPIAGTKYTASGDWLGEFSCFEIGGISDSDLSRGA